VNATPAAAEKAKLARFVSSRALHCTDAPSCLHITLVLTLTSAFTNHCVRHQVAKVVRGLLVAALPSEITQAPQMSRFRAIMPSLKAWCECVTGSTVSDEGRLVQTTPVVTAAEDDVCLLYKFTLLLQADGDMVGCEVWARQCLALVRRVMPTDMTRIAYVQTQLGRALADLGRFQDAVAEGKAAVELFKSNQLNGSIAFADALVCLGHAMERNGDTQEAVRVCEEAVTQHRWLSTKPTLNMAMALSALARSYDAAGRNEEALQLKEESLKIHIDVLLDSDPEITCAMGNVAVSYLRVGRLVDSERLGRDVLDRRRRYYGDSHSAVATALSCLGHVCLGQGRSEEALELFEKALAIFRQVCPPNHPDISMLMGNVASTHVKMGRFEKGLDMQREVLKLRMRALQPDHPDIANTWYTLACTHDAQHDMASAVKCARAAIQLFEKMGMREDFAEYQYCRSIVKAGEPVLQVRNFTASNVLPLLCKSTLQSLGYSRSRVTLNR
jgi:tetratricopeptide (TPR) repeat protein